MVSHLSRRRVLAACGALAGSVTVGQGLIERAARSSAAPQNDDSTGWPMEQHDPGGTSYAPDASPPKDAVRVRWKQPIEMNDSIAHSTPIVGNGLVYGVGQELVCVAATSSDVVFRSDLDFPGPPALATARAYQSPTLAFPTWDGAVGLNAWGGLSVGAIRVGLTRWQASYENRGSSDITIDSARMIPGPVAADGTLFVSDTGTGTGVLAIDASTGRIRWRSHYGQSHPAGRGGTVYVVGLAKSGYRSLFGYAAETGEQTFSFSPGPLLVSVTAAPDSLVVGTDSSGLLGVDYNGTLRWKYNPTELQLTRDAIAVADGIAYAWFLWGSRDWLVAIDVTDGTELWRSELASVTRGLRSRSPAVANGVVYVPIEGGPATEDGLGGGLAAVDATTGRVRWRFSPGKRSWLSPAALAGEMLYTLGNGYLYALEER